MGNKNSTFWVIFFLVILFALIIFNNTRINDDTSYAKYNNNGTLKQEYTSPVNAEGLPEIMENNYVWVLTLITLIIIIIGYNYKRRI